MNFKINPRLQNESFKWYDIEYFNLPMPEFVSSTYHGIFVFNPPENFISKKIDFFKPLNIITNEELNNFLEHTLDFLDRLVGRTRLVNPRQFELIKGSIVKSKTEPRLGKGVVKMIDLKSLQALVVFPEAQAFYHKKELSCHVSSLRVLSHIEEIRAYERKK